MISSLNYKDDNYTSGDLYYRKEMKIIIKMILSQRDENHYKDDIIKLVDLIEPYFIDFYKEFGIEITGIIYNSQLEWGQKTSISCEFDKPKKLYPELKINISELGSGFKVPSRRIFFTRIHIHNLSKLQENYLWKQYELSTMSDLIEKDGNDAHEKLKYVIGKSLEFATSHMNHDKIYQWIKF